MLPSLQVCLIFFLRLALSQLLVNTIGYWIFFHWILTENNSKLFLQALKQFPREKVQVATKFGIAGMGPTSMIVKGTPEYVRACCEASLKRLDTEYIDLYYQHRVDTSIPIEETVDFLYFMFSWIEFFCLLIRIQKLSTVLFSVVLWFFFFLNGHWLNSLICALILLYL